MQAVPVQTEINQNIIKLLATKTAELSDINKHCILTFDEMALKKELRYNSATDKVDGLVELLLPQPIPCNQALVFMVKGLASKWKQPLSYYFSSNAAPAHSLRTLMFQALEALLSIQLKPVAVVCDQGAPNLSLYASLGVTQEKPYFEVNRAKN